MCDRQDELIQLIRIDYGNRKRNEEPLRINILDRSSTKLDGDFLHSQLIIDVYY